MLTAVMFPLWPYTLRLGVWYLSMGVMGLLGAFFAMAILRLIFYVITLVVAKPGIWVFPRLFEDVSFVRPLAPPPFSLSLCARPRWTDDACGGQMDSWTPLWGWDIPPKKKKSSKDKDGKSAGAKGGKKGSKGTKAAKAGAESTGETTATPNGEEEAVERKPYKGATVEEVPEGEDD